MKYIIYPQKDNTIAIVASTGILPIEEVATRDVPPDTPYKILETLDIISDFHNAYEFDQALGAKINISKAKDIQKDRFRVARKPILEKLDVDYIRAIETGNITKQAEIAVKKQVLRDITNIELPDTLDELKSVWPDVLNG